MGSSRNRTSGSLGSALASANALAQALGQGAAGLPGPVDQVHRPQRTLDAVGGARRLVQLGEALEVLENAPAQVPEPDVGAMSVPSVRTVVVLPAPFGPRKPKTSP
ncbi:MAG: hypothetical protein QOI35_2707 [Cryptosporangiaceae bacterium]|nr:hypothetical protein [Cryptosporangiaceae bacterium]